jgi:hypothetical protein
VLASGTAGDRLAQELWGPDEEIAPTAHAKISRARRAPIVAEWLDAELAALPARLAPLVRPEPPARVDTRRHADVWFEPTLVVEVLAAELTLSPTHTAAWDLLKEDSGLALRFPRFTGRWRDDKAAEDATTVEEVVGMFRAARRAPAGA